jgi:hypothetical protein
VTDPFFTPAEDLTDEELIERINRNRRETDEYNQEQLGTEE